MKKNVTIQMDTEFAARPIAQLVQTANAFQSRIYLEMGSARANAKSIMGVMGLAMMTGEQLVIDAEGEDETEAADALAKLLQG
jgi:phosphotransferase system HPr (HPr) family protein